MRLLAPSFYAHVFNGILLFISFIVIIMNRTVISKLDIYKKTIMLLLFTLAVGVHGISHLGLEKTYHFNPLANNAF